MNRPSVLGSGPPRRSETIKRGYVDAARGWAVVLVITCHAAYAFPQLPYPVRKATNFGWHGVQLFFLASAVTLMMSWRRNPSVQRFFLHRFLRIAPMYYLAAAFYYFAHHASFDAAQLIRSLLFVNAWHPEWLPTTPGWMVVPGGWSISVEFAFYALFPLLAANIRTPGTALFYSLLSLPLSLLADHWAAAWLADYDPVAVKNFLYFWFPNQLPVFLFGIVLFYVLERAPSYSIAAPAVPVVVLAGVGLAAAEHPQWFTHVPILWLACALFMAFVFVLAKGPASFATHPWIRAAGTMSFSAYLVHFYVIDRIALFFDTNSTGLAAVALLVPFWLLTLAATFAVSAVTYRLIERPFIDLAGRLSGKAAPAVPSLRVGRHG